ncbi:MAG: hypothetical protein ACSHYA_01705 [Opitutaceae bacterium]
MKSKKEGKVAIYVLGIFILGLGLYIGSFVLDVGGDLKDAQERSETEKASDPSLQRLVKAEKLVASDKSGTEHGNTETARKIALNYSVILGKLRGELFTEGKDNPVSLSNGFFLTYCNLSQNQCAFIVHVPQLRNYTNDAKLLLHKIAWAAAVEAAARNGKIESIAVGIRGALVYDAVFIGDNQIHTQEMGHTDGRKALRDFF